MIQWITIALLAIFSTQSLHSFSGNRADYVIVGVGTAGGLMAKKLSDDKKTSVIALHTGQNFTNSFILKYGKNTLFSVAATLLGDPPPFDVSDLDLPPDLQQQLQDLIDLTATTAKPLYEKGFTPPQPNQDDEVLFWVIPLPEGGGSIINAGALCRGTNQLYADWEAIAGPQWAPGLIMNIYKELEHYRGKTTNRGIHGYNGPLEVIQNPNSQLAKVFTQAVVNGTGTPFVYDYNDPNTPIGASSQIQLTRSGEEGYYRVSSVSAFLNENVVNSKGKGVDGRKLQIFLNSFALRTIWNGTTAVGVEYIQDGVVKQVFANKGVIVCAGLRSSTFLMYSGIGDPAVLTPLAIPVIYDNPNVGQALVDQAHVITMWTSNPNDSNSNGNSPFASIAWLPDPTGVRPGRQLRFTTVDVIPGVTPALFDIVQPQSMGTISINSVNPLDPPVINFNYLDPTTTDLDLFVNGFTTYIQNINTAIQAIDPSYQLILPPPDIFGDPLLLAAFIEAQIEANMHFQGHCRMAPLADGGVVDSNGSVYGVSNLYVADNSINPSCMDGSPMATGYMVAYNIARMLGY